MKRIFWGLAITVGIGILAAPRYSSAQEPSPGPSQAAPAPAPSETPRPILPLVAKFLRGQKQLKEIYDGSKLDRAGETPAHLRDAVSKYRETLPASDRELADRFVLITQMYPPIYSAGELRVRFDQKLYSFSGMERLFGTSLLAEAFLVPASLEELRALAALLGIPDPTQRDIAAMIRDAGDLFTLVSDGDRNLSVRELTYIFSYFGSGAVTTIAMLRDLVPACGMSVGSVEDGTSRIPSECFQRQLAAHYSEWFDNLPALVSALDRAGASQRETYFNRILTIIGEVTGAQIDLLRLQLFSSAVLAMEGVFTRFDRDLNGVFDTQESLDACAVYQTLIRQVSGLNNRGWIEGAFTYLLRYGEAPSSTGFQLVKFLAWMVGRPFWKLKVDRFRAAQVIELVLVANGKFPGWFNSSESASPLGQ